MTEHPCKGAATRWHSLTELSVQLAFVVNYKHVVTKHVNTTAIRNRYNDSSKQPYGFPTKWQMQIHVIFDNVIKTTPQVAQRLYTRILTEVTMIIPYFYLILSN